MVDGNRELDEEGSMDTWLDDGDGGGSVAIRYMKEYLTRMLKM